MYKCGSLRRLRRLENAPHSWTSASGPVLTIIRIRIYNGAMIVCVCKAVSERHIRAAVKEGATRVQDLSRRLGLGTCCGKCLPQARTTLADSLGHHRNEACAPAYFPNNPEFAV